jgi:hypothetical protein
MSKDICLTLCTCRPTRGLACKFHWDPINEVRKEPTKEASKEVSNIVSLVPFKFPSK